MSDMATDTAIEVPYERGGRTRQKGRTRQALLAAARELIARDGTATVEQAAALARVSRTTAYRYFPTQRALLLAAHPEIGVTSMLPDRAPDDPAQRLDLVIVALTRKVLQTERQQRTMLRLSLEATPAERRALLLRQGRAIGWILEALAPLARRIPSAALRDLALSIRSATGIEALVWLVDVAGLSRRRAVQRMRWSAAAMLRAALLEHRGTGRTPAATSHSDENRAENSKAPSRK